MRRSSASVRLRALVSACERLCGGAASRHRDHRSESALGSAVENAQQLKTDQIAVERQRLLEIRDAQSNMLDPYDHFAPPVMYAKWIGISTPLRKYPRSGNCSQT